MDLQRVSMRSKSEYDQNVMYKNLKEIIKYIILKWMLAISNKPFFMFMAKECVLITLTF